MVSLNQKPGKIWLTVLLLLVLAGQVQAKKSRSAGSKSAKSSKNSSASVPRNVDAVRSDVLLAENVGLGTVPGYWGGGVSVMGYYSSPREPGSGALAEMGGWGFHLGMSAGRFWLDGGLRFAEDHLAQTLNYGGRSWNHQDSISLVYLEALMGAQLYRDRSFRAGPYVTAGYMSITNQEFVDEYEEIDNPARIGTPFFGAGADTKWFPWQGTFYLGGRAGIIRRYNIHERIPQFRQDEFVFSLSMGWRVFAQQR